MHRPTNKVFLHLQETQRVHRPRSTGSKSAKPLRQIALSLCFSLACCAAYAGWLMKDVPAELMKDPSVERMTIEVPTTPAGFIAKMKAVRVRCGGGQMDDSLTDRRALVVVWQSESTVVFIVDVELLEAEPAKSNATIYMNTNVGRQRATWARVLDNWFVAGNERCIADIRRDS